MFRFKTIFALALPLPLIMLAVQAAPAASWVQLNSLGDLPAAVRASLASGMSDRGGPFNAGCVAQKDVPQSRFVLAARQPDVLVVAVEHGGFAHYVETLEYRQSWGQWKLARRGQGKLQVDSAQALVAQHQGSAPPTAI